MTSEATRSVARSARSASRYIKKLEGRKKEIRIFKHSPQGVLEYYKKYYTSGKKKCRCQLGTGFTYYYYKWAPKNVKLNKTFEVCRHLTKKKKIHYSENKLNKVQKALKIIIPRWKFYTYLQKRRRLETKKINTVCEDLVETIVEYI